MKTKRQQIVSSIIDLSNQLYQLQNGKPRPKTEALLQSALLQIGVDASPNDVAPDELGCAETINDIHMVAFGDPIGGTVSTGLLYEALKVRKDFIKLDVPESGCIIISPTGQGNGKIKNGHTGIIDNNLNIMSNDSASGNFKQNYTIQTWRNRWEKIGGYPILFYKKI